MIEELRARFEEEHGRRPRLFRAPGRVNIIGEHTDYNDGFALPAAIDLAIVVAAAPRADRRVRARSLALGAAIEFDLDAAAAPSGDWGDYIRGVVLMLRREGCEIGGADLMIAGDLPMGAGLSASAALEVAAAVAMTALADRMIGRVELAKLCQRAENEFVGARCGVMDQYASCCGAAGHALLLDCRTLRAEPIAIAPSARLVVCDSMVRHRIAGGEYNQRRRECEQAVALLAQRLPGVAALRDVTLDALARNAEALPDVLYRRARHVIGENARTLRAAAALQDGDLPECGRLMNLSHESLRDDYEVSCPELDCLVAIARGLSGVHGARMMGGGFGGCVIGLVDASAADSIVDAIRAAYGEAIGEAPSVFCCAPAQGAGPVEI
jgi:galactokinase